MTLWPSTSGRSVGSNPTLVVDVRQGGRAVKAVDSNILLFVCILKHIIYSFGTCHVIVPFLPGRPRLWRRQSASESKRVAAPCPKNEGPLVSSVNQRQLAASAARDPPLSTAAKSLAVAHCCGCHSRPRAASPLSLSFALAGVG